MITPCKLRVEYKNNPIGMDEKTPRFSLEITGNGSGVRQVRMIVTEAETEMVVWDNADSANTETQQIEYCGLPLKPFTRYNWTVQLTDNDGNVTKNTEEAFFETGLLGLKWDAKWLSCAWGGTYNPLSRFLRDFKTTGKIIKARLYATALGAYDVFLNGVPIGNDCLKPGWTDFFERVQYQAFDVTSLLRDGDNTLAATVADGWFVAKGYGQCPMFSAILRITYENGETETILTDKEWRAFYIHIQNPMRMSNIYNGEVYEAWEETDWKMPGGYRTYYAVPAKEVEPNNPKIKRLKVVWQSGPSMKHMHKMTPVSIVKRPNATWLVDFGQNFAGREQIRLKNTMQGTTIVIKHGEMLNPDGSLYIENLRNAWQRTIYTTGTHEEEIYEPLYTFYGFRYLEISGWPGELTSDDICAFAVYSNLEKTGDFTCSEPLLNKLYSNIVWGQRSNFVDVPTDCPQRDERQGWTGDTQVFANMATYNMACGDFYTKWLEDLNLDQGKEGAYPYIVPVTSQDQKENGSAGWGDAGIVVPFIMLLKYGDIRVVKRYFKNMVAWINWQLSKAGGSLIVKTSVFGDWLNVDAEIDRVYLATAYLAGMTKLLSKMGFAIHEDIQAQHLANLAENIKSAICDTYFKDGEITVRTQTAAVLALHFKLCPDKESEQKTLEYLKHDIVVERKLHLSTGFLGTPLLLETLTEYGEIDLAYDLLLQTTYPAWLYPVTQGATTMWERWNSWTDKDGFGDPEMNSFNHYAYGAVGDWFFERILGICPNKEFSNQSGFKCFTLAPQPGKKLSSAEGSYHSVFGKISSKWNKENGTFTWSFSVPVHTTAKIKFPDGMSLSSPLPACFLTGTKDADCIAVPGEYTLQFSYQQ